MAHLYLTCWCITQFNLFATANCTRCSVYTCDLHTLLIDYSIGLRCSLHWLLPSDTPQYIHRFVLDLRNSKAIDILMCLPTIMTVCGHWRRRQSCCRVPRRPIHEWFWHARQVATVFHYVIRYSLLVTGQSPCSFSSLSLYVSGQVYDGLVIRCAWYVIANRLCYRVINFHCLSACCSPWSGHRKSLKPPVNWWTSKVGSVIFNSSSSLGLLYQQHQSFSHYISSQTNHDTMGTRKANLSLFKFKIQFNNF